MTVDPSDAYDGERISRLVLAILETELPAALEAVEARWADEAAVPLTDPVTLHLGFKPTLLELESSAFPIIAVIPGERIPQGSVKAWGAQREHLVIDTHFFVAAGSIDEVEPQVWRYAEAIVGVFQNNRVIGRFAQEDYKPEIEFGVAGRHPKARGANLQKDSDTDYVQGGRVTIELAGG